MSEWANYRSSPESSTHGWSARGRQTYGAFCPGTECGGSSSGSAVATVLGLAGACIGTEVSMRLEHIIGVKIEADIPRPMGALFGLHTDAMLLV